MRLPVKRFRRLSREIAPVQAWTGNFQGGLCAEASRFPGLRPSAGGRGRCTWEGAGRDCGVRRGCVRGAPQRQAIHHRGAAQLVRSVAGTGGRRRKGAAYGVGVLPCAQLVGRGPDRRDRGPDRAVCAGIQRIVCFRGGRGMPRRSRGSIPNLQGGDIEGGAMSLRRCWRGRRCGATGRRTGRFISAARRLRRGVGCTGCAGSTRRLRRWTTGTEGPARRGTGMFHVERFVVCH